MEKQVLAQVWSELKPGEVYPNDGRGDSRGGRAPGHSCLQRAAPGQRGRRTRRAGLWAASVLRPVRGQLAILLLLAQRPDAAVPGAQAGIGFS